MARFRLSDLIEKFRDLNSPFFDDEKIQIEIEVPDIVVEAEESKLFRVVQNLVGNAIDAFDGGCGKITVSARTAGEDSFVLEVSDNGDGIPEDIRDRFFEPFVTRGKSKGTGLGSAIIKSIVDAHHGSVDFETESGVGTTFTVHLPLRQPTLETVGP